MFDINQYPEIINHFRLRNRRCKRLGSGWHETFCHYCNDSTRKSNPGHGHFHIAPDYPFAHCHRCGTKVSLAKALVDTGFNDERILSTIKKNSNFTYSKSKFDNYKISSSRINESSLLQEYDNFSKSYPEQFDVFRKYIFKRCLNINPIQFLLLPSMDKQRSTQVKIFNYSNQLVTTRNIIGSTRYINASGGRKYYYFQDILDIDMYDNIVICEGTFDLINLYNYYYGFKKSFFISIGSNNYNGAITDLINNYLLIGKYNIQIVFDKNVKFLERVKHLILNNINILNPEIKVQFYIPILTNDVSELMLIEQI